MLERIQEARKNEGGFTLIELLMVIVILGVLAGIVVFAVSGIQDKGNKAACQADVKSVTVAAEAYYANGGTGAYPLTAAVQTALVPTFLHSWPGDVDYASTDGKTYTATGTGACAGYTG